MKNIRFVHNPYLNKTELSIDGKELTDGPLFELVNERRLQVWIEDFIPELRHHCNEDEYSIAFIGIEQDFNDLEEVVKKSDFNVNIEHISKGQADPDKKTSQLKELFKKAKEGPIEEFKTDEIDQAFNKALQPEFEICVVATMSAGKSTLINAILGEDLQPSENKACTATITTIADYDEMEYFRGRKIGDDDEWVPVNKDILKQWNNDKVPHIEIQGNIPMIRADNTRLVLVDTPGPNNSMDHRHKECTIGAIKDDQKPMILYILNATQLSTTDDQTLLQIVSQEMMKGGKQSHDRFMFVVNKIDGFDPEKEPIPSVIDNVREYLENNGLKNPNIYPISALLTKLIREHLNSIELTRSERNDMKKGIEIFNEVDSMSMVQYMPLSPTVKKVIYKRIEEAKAKENEHELAMLNSGVPAIEEVMQEYLIKYALPAKIFDAKMSFEHILRKHETLASLNNELNKSIDDLEQINLQVVEIQDKLKKGEEAKKFKSEIQDYSWKKSKSYADTIRELEKGFTKNLNEFQSQFGSDNLTPQTADRVLKDMVSQASVVMTSIQYELDKTIQADVLSKIKDLQDDYNAYVRGIVGDIGDISPVMRELTKSVQLLLDTKRLVKNATESKSEISGGHYVKKSKWWNPFSWGSKEWVDEYKKVEYVESQTLYSYFADELRASLADNEKMAEEEAKKQIEECKEKFLQQMESIDTKIEEILSQMKEKTSSKEALQVALKENQAKIDWLNLFKSELDNVLSI